MYAFAPAAWPTAKLLDWLLGENHGVVYKKSGLKTLVTLHKSLGSQPAERLNEDEVTIITAVLDLKAKAVQSIMTPMEHVFTVSTDSILDEKTMELILSAGFSRIPVHEPNDPSNFLGMLLVKTLITYDPEDSKPVAEFVLATLPETSPETSCLDILNYFQEGHSHMALVSKHPGENGGAIGVVTLEDVVEELIGEYVFPSNNPYRPFFSPHLGKSSTSRTCTMTPRSLQTNSNPLSQTSLYLSTVHFGVLPPPQSLNRAISVRSRPSSASILTTSLRQTWRGSRSRRGSRL